MKNIPHNFQLYLSNTVRVPAHQISYYLRWVDRFLKSETLMGMPRTEAFEKFRSTLIDTSTAWQVKQACEAVKHYWFWLDRSHSLQENPRASGPQMADLLDETQRLTPDDPKRDMQPVSLPENEAALFQALFPKL